MEKTVLVILFGGMSEEHPISLKSAYNVIVNLDKEKYEIIMLGITKEGKWLKFDGPIDLLLTNEWYLPQYTVPAVIAPDKTIHGLLIEENNTYLYKRVDVVFPMLHGKFGEDGVMQGLLELSGIPYVGCKVESSVLCMNKDLAASKVEQAGVNVTPSVVINRNEDIKEKLDKISKLKYPLFVKPASSGSSFGVTKINNQSELDSAIKEASQFSDRILIEQGVTGYEIGCAVLGEGENLIVGEIDKINLSHGFFRIHQEEKPEVESENSTITVPAPISQELTKKVKEEAKKIYFVLNCTGLARVDMFLTPEDEIVFNEVNSMPGFTSYSRYPRMMEASGLNISYIVNELINLALK